MFYLIIVLFIVGYATIVLEYKLSVDKAAIALATGALIWICVASGGNAIYSALPSFQEYLQTHPDATVMEFVNRHELTGHLSRISEVLFFLLGSMAIVKIIDHQGCFNMLTTVIKTANKAKLLWIFSFLAFFMSAVLDNLTTTILMITMMCKFISSKNMRCIFAGMIVIAVNAGGAWSPIGDVSTLMMWTGGYVSAWSIITQLFVPCLICMLVPLIILSLNVKGDAVFTLHANSTKAPIPATNRNCWTILLSGIGGLMLVPVFKSITHLPPYIGVLLVLGVMWVIIEMMHRKKQKDAQPHLILADILNKTDMSTIFYFLGILLAVAGLASAGHLRMAGLFLDGNMHNIYTINLVIGALSSVIDNVTLVAGSTGMYDLVSPDVLIAVPDPAKAAYLKYFVTDGSFWQLLAYSACNGGSILVIGSAAGIAAMRMAKIDFLWYLKKISLVALAGYLLGFAAYYLIVR